MIEYSEASRLIRLDSDTGEMYWKVNRTGGTYAGDKVGGTITKAGYKNVKILGNKILSHRLIWMLHYGEYPNGSIDHINHNRTDNRICNLRIASAKENGQNASMHSRNTSGYTGVTFHKQTNKWVAQINTCGKSYRYSFDLKEDAIEKRKQLVIEFGFHGNHGK